MDYATYVNGVFEECLQLFQEAIQYATEFIETKAYEEYHRLKPARIECAVNSRYMHRGFHCPSPVFEKVVTNARRGKILRYPRKNSKLTHRYYYNQYNKIYMIEYFYEGITEALEYIIRKNNKRFGVVIDESGFIRLVSVEEYRDGKLATYICTRCYCLEDRKYCANNMRYEHYYYNDEENMTDFDWNRVFLDEDEYKKLGNAVSLVEHHNYNAQKDRRKL